MDKIPTRSKKHKSTMITVEQLVDIALGNPEIGSVNFNVLHALLHVIIQQLNIQRCLVEFKGSDSERMEGLIMTAKPGPILKVTEYMIDLADGKPCNVGKGEPPGKTSPERPCPQGRARSALFKNDTNICQGKEESATEEEKVERSCDCGAPPEKKKKHSPAEETEKTDNVQEKSDASKEESEVRAKKPEPRPKEVEKKKGGDTEPESDKEGKKLSKKGEDTEPESDKEGKKLSKKGEDTEPESDKEGKKLSKKERCKEKKLAKRKKREEEEGNAATLREKSETEQIEEETGKKAVSEGRKQDSTCPCKEGHKAEEKCPEQKMKGTSSSYYGSESDACQTIVRVEAIGERCDTWRTRPALAHESLVKLEEKVALLQDAFETLEKMPTNEELMKRTSGTGPCPSTPVKDMWQLYNLNKRVESCEGAIEKLASMIEDLVKETCNFREAMMVIADAVDSMECNEDSCATGVSPCCGAGPGQPHRGQPIPPPSTEGNQEVIAFPITAPSPCGAFSQPSPDRPKTSDNQTAEVQVADAPEVETGRDRPRQTSHQMEARPPGSLGPDFFKLTTGEKFCVLKESIECLTCQLKSFTDLIPLDQLAAKLCAIVTMQKQLDNLQKEWEAFLQSFSNEGVPGAVGYIKTLRLDIEMINETISKILENRRQLEITIQSITQEINMLKAIKADKETMEDLLAEKADASIVNKKVSHDQFDAACDDLTKGLDEALERLIAQEALWNEAMEELQRDMESKLDKVEIMPLKEFINKKLKGLQEKLKQLAQLRKDAEAAGAKSRILRNLNCISCDNDVVMRMENKNALQHPTLNSSRSMRPYIAYELDQVRKALKKGPTCRGLNQVEEMVAEVQKKTIGLPLGREGVETKLNKLEHYCNRYCGGSHTITTPQQRVTRIGHFLTEFGPHAMAIFNQDNVNLPDCKPLDTGNLPIPQKDIKLV